MPGRQVVTQQQEACEHGEAEHGARGGGEVHGPPPVEDEEPGDGEAGGEPHQPQQDGGQVGGVGGEAPGPGAHEGRGGVGGVEHGAEYLDDVSADDGGAAELLHQTVG